MKTKADCSTSSFICMIFACEDKYRRKKEKKKTSALAGNRTRVARVASEHSTTEPPVLVIGLYGFSFRS